ncbi:MAG: helix-turn-helix domain-containing protein [Eubacterium sp.]|jgi:transcriptional regulator with XRE-family HTH domain|nr:helix-turn-helix domain-containing protein [Eubacterium sp.]
MESKISMEIGGRVRRQREMLGISRERLALYLDVSPKFIADIELGIKGMSLTTLMKMSSALKLSTDYILFGKSEKTDLEPLLKAFSLCTKEKIQYAEELLKLFLKAIAN